MNGLIDLLEVLYKKFPNSIPTDKGYTIDAFRVMQGRQDVVNYIEQYIKSLENKQMKLTTPKVKK